METDKFRLRRPSPKWIDLQWTWVLKTTEKSFFPQTLSLYELLPISLLSFQFHSFPNEEGEGGWGFIGETSGKPQHENNIIKRKPNWNILAISITWSMMVHNRNWLEQRQLGASDHNTIHPGETMVRIVWSSTRNDQMNVKDASMPVMHQDFGSKPSSSLHASFLFQLVAFFCFLLFSFSFCLCNRKPKGHRK